MESQLVAPLDQELLGIPKQQSLRSTSKYAIADLTLTFDEGDRPLLGARAGPSG